jgi:hypothetical protein
VTGPDDQPERDLAVLLAITDPVECARLLTQLSKKRGNLSPDESRLRRLRITQARYRDGRKVLWLATKVGLAQSGISRLTDLSLLSTQEGAAA